MSQPSLDNFRALLSHANIALQNGSAYLPNIVDRLNSYHAQYDASGDNHTFDFSFGRIEIESKSKGYRVALHADDDTGLHRLKDLAAVAIKLYTKEEAPEIIWQGDRAGQQVLPQFRLMRVISNSLLTPRMLRMRLAGEDLKRFSLFGAMHIRLLLPTIEVPQPVWPIMGPNGLPFWPDDDRKPASRAYTIRSLNLDEGWLEIDFYLHEVEGLACTWAKNAKPGDQVGLMGPVGRPLRQASRYLIGADATGLPAIGRMLAEFSDDVTGRVVIAVDSEKDVQDLVYPSGVSVEWIIDSDQKRAAETLTQVLCEAEWPEGPDSFGWFAGEADQAKIVRQHWRQKLGKSREETLVAGYWHKDAVGFMAV
ncbi:siderophore-interacting protein [Brucella pseudogrignonensis]|uniref:siderophore-interacting protein n=1 Tax=Brucella pseudogrignonensis TaxID=419475 RepID=UPI0028B40048|nr:siderophore-interacting protein [Brucella pseudogrignonensis]MDT6941576.1 siderophore-interacting protein [Brucella pseudogrignonensis]